MRKSTILGVFAVGLMAVGCAGGGSRGGYAPASAPESASAGYGESRAAQPGAPASEAEPMAADSAKSERPGLGTEWGENVSLIHI